MPSNIPPLVITDDMLSVLCDKINTNIGSPSTMRNPQGVSNIGHYFLDKNSRDKWCLAVITKRARAHWFERGILPPHKEVTPYKTRKQIYAWMEAYICGLEHNLDSIGLSSKAMVRLKNITN